MKTRSVSVEKLAEVAVQPENRRMVVLLDYDDTLCPSSWVLEEANIFVSKTTKVDGDEIEETYHLTSSTEAKSMGKQESAAIDFILSIVGNEDDSTILKIITNGDASWLRQSLRSFLPLFDRYLVHHQIEVISARDRYESAFPDDPIQWKVYAFRDEIRSAQELFRQRVAEQTTVSMKTAVSPSQTSQEAASTDSDKGAMSTPSSSLSSLSMTMSVEMSAASQSTDGGDKFGLVASVPSPSPSPIHDQQQHQQSPPTPEGVQMEMLIVSIGDGEHERQASHCIANELDIGWLSIKLLEAPMPMLLDRELGLVTENLPRVIEHYWSRLQAADREGAVSPAADASEDTVMKKRQSRRFRSNLDLQVAIRDHGDALVITNYEPHSPPTAESDHEYHDHQEPQPQQGTSISDGYGEQKELEQTVSLLQQQQQQQQHATASSGLVALRVPEPLPQPVQPTQPAVPPFPPVPAPALAPGGSDAGGSQRDSFTFFRDWPLDTRGLLNKRSRTNSYAGAAAEYDKDEKEEEEDEESDDADDEGEEVVGQGRVDNSEGERNTNSDDSSVSPGFPVFQEDEFYRLPPCLALSGHKPRSAARGGGRSGFSDMWPL
jgi:hypothetical protein